MSTDASTRIPRASDKEGGQLEGLLRVRQSEGLIGLGVKPEESETVLVRQFVEHEYVTHDAVGRLRGTQLEMSR